MPGVQLTAKQRILVAVVSAVVVAVTQVFGVDADVGAVTLDLARWTRSVSWREQRKDSYGYYSSLATEEEKIVIHAVKAMTIKEQ